MDISAAGRWKQPSVSLNVPEVSFTGDSDEQAGTHPNSAGYPVTNPPQWDHEPEDRRTGVESAEDGLKRLPVIGRGRRVSMVTKRHTGSTLELKKMTKINLNDDSKSVH